MRLLLIPAALVDLEGKILESPLGHTGSKETGFHLSAYRLRSDVMVVVHVHPPYSTAFSCTGNSLPLSTIPARLILKEVPCLPCFNPGSRELADQVTEAIKKYPNLKALLMQDHGILVWGRICIPRIIPRIWWSIPRKLPFSTNKSHNKFYISRRKR
jgi:L-fuculose-phosphate aldolase